MFESTRLDVCDVVSHFVTTFTQINAFARAEKAIFGSASGEHDLLATNNRSRPLDSPARDNRRGIELPLSAQVSPTVVREQGIGWVGVGSSTRPQLTIAQVMIELIESVARLRTRGMDFETRVRSYRIVKNFRYGAVEGSPGKSGSGPTSEW